MLLPHLVGQLEVLLQLFLLLILFNVGLILFFWTIYLIVVSALFILVLLVAVHKTHPIDLGQVHLLTGSGDLILICATLSICENFFFLT